jgi:antirestriction protein ArdC
MNVYEVVTDRILASLRNGVVPWRCPWRVETPKNLISKKEYRGVNVLLLQSTPYESPYWLTFNQARLLKGTVKRGERGCPVIYWKTFEDDGNERERRFVLRYYTVFNLAQTEGIAAPPTAQRRAFDPIVECEKVVTGYVSPPQVQHGGGRACYVPARDTVQMPSREAFTSSPEYYSTLFHEIVHSTGASHRLARKGVVDPNSFASHSYSFEELIAECGASFLSSQAGISASVLENSASYIAHWAHKLRDEPKWIVSASAQAAKAADLVLGRASQSAENVDQAA